MGRNTAPQPGSSPHHLPARRQAELSDRQLRNRITVNLPPHTPSASAPPRLSRRRPIAIDFLDLPRRTLDTHRHCQPQTARQHVTLSNRIATPPPPHHPPLPFLRRHSSPIVCRSVTDADTPTDRPGGQLRLPPAGPNPRGPPDSCLADRHDLLPSPRRQPRRPDCPVPRALTTPASPHAASMPRPCRRHALPAQARGQVEDRPAAQTQAGHLMHSPQVISCMQQTSKE
jgi:hypothetical protein